VTARGAARAAFVLTSAAIACGGKAVVDRNPGAGGATAGHGGSSATGVDPSTGSNGLCGNHPATGKVSPCPGGNVSAGTGLPLECAAVVCDENGVTFESDCQGQTCRCKVNQTVVCTCAIDVGEMCKGAKSCCPTPFPS
jgi:hypothetical protein